MLPIILAMTGASGSIYGLRLLGMLLSMNRSVHFIASPACRQVLEQESAGAELERLLSNDNVTVYEPDDFTASIASGSVLNGGMVIAPCSGSSLGCIAAGVNQHLIHRAAEVQLKECRRLILLVRESPLSLIHLQNMERLAQAGAIIQPASPHFYSIGDSDFYSASSNVFINRMVDTVIARTLDLLGIEHALGYRYQSSPHKAGKTAG